MSVARLSLFCFQFYGCENSTGTQGYSCLLPELCRWLKKARDTRTEKSKNPGAVKSRGDQREETANSPFPSRLHVRSDFLSSHGHVRHHHHQGTPLRPVRPRGDAMAEPTQNRRGKRIGIARWPSKSMRKNGCKYRGAAGGESNSETVQRQPNGQPPPTGTAPRTPTPLTPTLRVSSRES